MKSEGGEKRVTALFLALLVLAIVVVYEPVRHNDFVEYDDDTYVTKNPEVNGGLSRESVKWAFTAFYAANWHPLTWLSHMLDCELYGLIPLGHHVTNVLLHIASTLLLFVVLRKMTGAMWKSGFVAAVFAIHPVHVESVAWVAERKDVLSGFFWMLTMLAYVHYAKRPGIVRYVLVFGALCLGLMAKPMLVTLPFVLLLLDYWPLGRICRGGREEQDLDEQTQESGGGLQQYPVWFAVLEKLPLLAVVAISSVITFAAQRQGQAVAPLEVWPLGARVVNAFHSYFAYIVKMAYPVHLAVLYPRPLQMRIDSALLFAGAAAGLLYLWGRRYRWLTVGILWYVGTLVPVIGLVHVGAAVMADRYTYIPSIGVLIAVAWGAEQAFRKVRYHRVILWAAAGTVIIVMIVPARIQVGYWRDSSALFGHALQVTKNNFIIHNNYGGVLSKQGKYEEAMGHFREAVRISPEYLTARQNICMTLLKMERLDEAIRCYIQALSERQDFPDMHEMYNDLGWAYELKGDYEQAEVNYRRSLALKPDYPVAQGNLANVLRKQGKLKDMPDR